MPEPINLNRIRKARARAADAAQAAENRVRFGRAKSQRNAADTATEAERRRHAGHRLAPPED